MFCSSGSDIGVCKLDWHLYSLGKAYPLCVKILVNKNNVNQVNFILL